MTETPQIINELSDLASKYVNNTHRHVFLTGKAGTGKTTFLRSIVKSTFKNAVIVAPTGVAAINAGGVTIHSMFQLPFGAYIPDRNVQQINLEQQKINTPNTLFKGLQLNSIKRKIMQELELLIIDEVSMLRADLLDAIDQVLRTVRRNRNQSFGGVQVLFIGDLLQLPPVVRDNEWNYLKNYYASAYFFEAHALKSSPPIYIELNKVYRQSDDTFINLLNNLRNNRITEDDLQLLNQYYKPDYQPTLGDGIIQLTTHNNKADTLNRTMLDKLKGKSYFFDAEIKGDFNENSYPLEQRLELKEGAQVMFIKNDPTGQQRFFNGKIGTVKYINAAKEVFVTFENEPGELQLEEHVWENVRYAMNEATNEIEENKIGEFKHFPVKLAWAITVHKSQGLTFKKAVIDIGSAFAQGQVYVALSRLTSLDGLILTSTVNVKSLTLDATIQVFSTQQAAVDSLENQLQQEVLNFLQTYMYQCFDYSALDELITAHTQSYSDKENKSNKAKFHYWAVELQKKVEPLRSVGQKFIGQLNRIFVTKEANQLIQLKESVEAAKSYFEKELNAIITFIRLHKTRIQEESKIKQYAAEIEDLESRFVKCLQLLAKAATMIDSAIANKEFSKENVHSKELNAHLIEKRAVSAISSKTKRTNKVKSEKVKEEKVEKMNTFDITFDYYKSGKTLEEIAALRGLAITTIEGHLCRFIGEEGIDVSQFVSPKRMDNIITVIKTLDTTNLGPIKQSLSDDYTYTEIRFAVAEYERGKKG